MITLRLLCVGLLVMHGAHAGILKDVTHVTIGAGAGAAVGYGVQVLTDPTILSTGVIDLNTVAFFTAVGTLCGGVFTSYGKSLRVQLNLRNLDRQLIAYVMQLADGKKPAELIDEIQDYYVDTAFPLIVAVQNLVKQDDYLGASIELLEWIIESLPDDSARKTSMEHWLNELNTYHIYIGYALTFIKQDPRFTEMLKLKNMQDLGTRW